MLVLKLLLLINSSFSESLKVENKSIKLTASSTKKQYIEAHLNFNAPEIQKVEFVGTDFTYSLAQDGKITKKVVLDRAKHEVIMNHNVKTGVISVSAHVPKRRAIIEAPVLITDKGSKENKFRLVVNISQKPFQFDLTPESMEQSQLDNLENAKKEEVPDAESTTSANDPLHRFEVDLGVGINFVNYSQDLDDPLISSGFQSLRTPALLTELTLHATPRWSFKLAYRSSPGSIEDAEDTLTNSNLFQWVTTSGEVIRNAGTPILLPFEWKIYPQMRLGAESHSVPFLLIGEEISDPSTLEIMSLMTAAIGGGFRSQLTSTLWLETYLRYQHILNSSSPYTVTPSFAFDGSIGLPIIYQSGLKLGFYLYGQYLSYSFARTENSTEKTGQQSLIFTNLEFRIGYGF